MADAQDILRQFQDVTNGYIKQNEDSGAIKFLRATVKTLETITKKIDTFLKSKNIDVGERLSQLSEKGTSLKDQTKDLFNNTKSDVKSMGVKGFLRSKASGVKSALGNMFASDTEVSGAPPPTTSGTPGTPSSTEPEAAEQKEPGMLAKLQASITTLSTSIEALASKSMPAGGSSEGGGVEVTTSQSTESQDYKVSLAKSKERADKRDKEIAEEKAAVKGNEDTNKKSKGGGWLGKVLGGITKLGKFMVGSLGKILLKVVPALVGLTGKVMGRVLGKIAPRMAGMIARGTSGLLGGAAKMAGRGLMAAGRLAIPALWAGAKIAGGAIAGAIGTTGLIVAGGVVAAGLLIYGGYKLYKYLNRNEVGDNIFGQLTRLRLLMYGFNDAKKESYYKLLELEMMMKDYVQFKDNKVRFIKLDAKLKDEVRELFEVKADEKEKFAVLNTWFVKRFMPSLKSFLDAFMPLGPNLYLDKLDTLSKDQVFRLASTLVVPTNIYDNPQVPTFDNPATTVSKQEVDDMLTAIRTKAKEDSKAFEGQGAKKVSDSNSKQAAAATSTATAATTAVAKAAPTVTPPGASSTPSSSSDPTSPTKDGPTAEDLKKASNARMTNNLNTTGTGSKAQDAAKADTPQQEGEAPVKDIAGKSSDPQPASAPSESTKLSVAPGGLQPGDKSLQGIKFGPNSKRDRIFNLHPKVFSLFTGMTKEFNTLTGKDVPVNESFRSYDDQMALRQKYPNKAAKPGNSVHEYGMALDVNTPEANLLDEMGLLRKYGFTRPVGGETWHLEPAGVAVNPQAAKTDPQMREQALDSSPGRGGGGYGASKGSPLGKRNEPLQKKLYAEGSASTVDLAALTKKDESVQQYKGPASASATPPAATPTPTGKTETPLKPLEKVAGPTSTAVASVSTQDSLSRSGATTPPATSLEAPAKASTANLDPGAIGSKDLNPAQAVRKASGVVGMNPESMVTFAKLESSLDPKAGATTSSAKGLFQITKPTWNGLLSTQGGKYNVPKDADIYDPYYNSVIGISYAKENAASVLPLGKQAGLPDEVSLYLAHHFGPSGSKRLLDSYTKNPNMSTQEAVSSATFTANQSALAGKTVGEYIQSLRSKMSTAAGTPETAYKGMKDAGSTDSIPAGTQRVVGASNLVTETVPQSTSSIPTSSPSAPPTSPSTSKSTYSASSSSNSALASPASPTPSRMERSEMPAASAATTSPVPQSNVVAKPLPPQPSQTQNLNPSNEILTNQLNVLIDIKKILEGIGSMGPRSNGAGNSTPPAAAMQVSAQPSTPPPRAGSPTPQIAPISRTPSATSVSMSRRTLV